MSDARQLCLFKFDRPLLDRFGAAFFRAIPRQPGVYLFFGARGRTLYVGQSKNLRERLSYYKNARPEREPRKIIRLVHETRRIEIRRCDSASAAQLREIELIQATRPKFNAALTASRAYSFFGLAAEPNSLKLRLALANEARPGEEWFGAFKNRALCRRAFLGAGRVIWCENAHAANLYHLPLWLHERTRTTEWSLNAGPDAREELRALLQGERPDFAARVVRLIERCGDSFLQRVFECDLLFLAEFFELARRMRTLREKTGKRVLLQNEVDAAQLQERLGLIDSEQPGSILP